MSVKLGVAPIAWSNDDMPELGGETTLEQCLKEANEAGYIGIESGGKFPKKSSELIPKLDQFNLKLCSGWYGANLRKNSVEEEKKSIQEQLNLFKDCDAPCIVFAEVSGSIQGNPNRKLSTRPQMERDIGLIDDLIQNGEYQKIIFWLRNNVHKYGRSVNSMELIRTVTKEELSPNYFINHLKSKINDFC